MIAALKEQNFELEDRLKRSQSEQERLALEDSRQEVQQLRRALAQQNDLIARLGAQVQPPAPPTATPQASLSDPAAPVDPVKPVEPAAPTPEPQPVAEPTVPQEAAEAPEPEKPADLLAILAPLGLTDSLALLSEHDLNTLEALGAVDLFSLLSIGLPKPAAEALIAAVRAQQKAKANQAAESVIPAPEPAEPKAPEVEVQLVVAPLVSRLELQPWFWPTEIDLTSTEPGTFFVRPSSQPDGYSCVLRGSAETLATLVQKTEAGWTWAQSKEIYPDVAGLVAASSHLLRIPLCNPSNIEILNQHIGARVRCKEVEGVLGYLRFVGLTPRGLLAGIELDEAKGTTDGTLEMQTFFSCEFGRGVFTSVNAVDILATEPALELTAALYQTLLGKEQAKAAADALVKEAAAEEERKRLLEEKYNKIRILPKERDYDLSDAESEEDESKPPGAAPRGPPPPLPLPGFGNDHLSNIIVVILLTT